MKKNLHTNPLLFKIILLITCFMLVILYNKSKAAEVPRVSRASIRVVVNFKNDMEKNELTIRIISGTEGNMQLFIFSPDGILISGVSVCARKTTTIKALKKGFYSYECFDNDERMKSGNLIIK